MQDRSQLNGSALSCRRPAVNLYGEAGILSETDRGASLRHRRDAAQLPQAIDCLPRLTREAMLEGIQANEIIVGAYTDRSGRVCPMLAAHRHGGRTSLASFAHAWDRYTGAGKRPRPASERELRTLKTMLEASL